MKGGECEAMRQHFSTLVSGSECWRIHESGACTRVCMNSLRALQSRQAWGDCARRCSWSSTFLDSARDWTAWCESRAEPEELPSHNETLLNTTGRVTDGSDGELHGSNGKRVVVIVASVVLAVFGVAAALAILFTKPAVRNRSHRTFGSGPASSSSLGILGRTPDSSEMRRLANGARRHLKAMRSNID